MKAVIFCVFASLLATGAFGGSTFDEKSDAVKEITTKHKEVFGFAHLVLQHLESESKKTEPQVEESTKREAETLKTNVLTEFSDELKKASRTAVVKGRPLSAFECLAKLALEGRTEILSLHANFDKKINSVLDDRRKRLYLMEIQVALILNAVTELKEQSVKNIEEAKTGIQSLKADALKKIESGKKQLTALETTIPKPTLSEEYIALKTDMGKKFQDVKDTLFRRTQKCIA